MYGPLIVALITLPIFLIALFFSIVPTQLRKYYNGKRRFVTPYGNTTTFDDAHCDVDQLTRAGRADEIPKFREAYNKYRFWDKVEDNNTIAIAIAVLSSLVLVTFFLVGIIQPIAMRQEVAYWQNFVEMVDLTIGYANDYEKAGLAGNIIEYNSWLTQAKTSQEIYGNWSSYYNIDLSHLEYIILGGK